MKYITVDESGNITGMYLTNPGTGVSLSDIDWESVGPGYTYVNGKLIAPTAPSDEELLAKAAASKRAKLSLDCQSYLYNGFSSLALGTGHDYPSAQNDQQNLANATAAETSAYLWCSTNGAWELTLHSAEQIKQVNSDWVSYLNSAQAKLVTLLSSVSIAATVEAVSAIAWD